jgi:hypothetical protein
MWLVCTLFNEAVLFPEVIYGQMASKGDNEH